MLTGTLVTVVGFFPIGLNSGNAGEFTFTLFVVIAVSLLVSWIVAVLFVPLLGVTILPDDEGPRSGIGTLWRRILASRYWLACGIDWTTIGVTVAAFALALFGMHFVQQQFFPSSDSVELIVDWNPRGKTPRSPRRGRRSTASSASSCRATMASTTGRPTSE